MKERWGKRFAKEALPEEEADWNGASKNESKIKAAGERDSSKKTFCRSGGGENRPRRPGKSSGITGGTQAKKAIKSGGGTAAVHSRPS